MSYERFMQRFPRSPREVAIEIIAAVGILGSVIAIVQAWSSLPNPIPVHFDLSGKPNFWLSKGSIILLPLISLVINVLLTLRIPYPHRFRYPVCITEENAGRQYQIARSLLLWLKIEISWLITFVVWQIIRVAGTETEKINITFPIVIIFVLLVTIGIHLAQSYSAR